MHKAQFSAAKEFFDAHLLKDMELELVSELLTIDHSKRLGGGSFGVVHAGT